MNLKHTESTAKDNEKVIKFKEKTDKLSKYKKHYSKEERLKILQNAINDLELTEEPIENYYEIGSVLGAGNFGVVHKANSVCKILSNF